LYHQLGYPIKIMGLIQKQLTLPQGHPIVHAMDSPISLLDQKLTELISLLEQSRARNIELRASLELAEARCQQLESQMDAARNKLEQVVSRLPESVNL
jgi:chromosome segregation ATPase